MYLYRTVENRLRQLTTHLLFEENNPDEKDSWIFQPVSHELSLNHQ